MVPSHVGPPRFNGLLHAASRTLNRPGRGGRQALRHSDHGRPNKSLQRSADSGNVIRETRRLVALRARPLNSSVMSPLHVSMKKLPAAPQLNAVEIVWIIREAG